MSSTISISDFTLKAILPYNRLTYELSMHLQKVVTIMLPVTQSSLMMMHIAPGTRPFDPIERGASRCMRVRSQSWLPAQSSLSHCLHRS